LSWRGKLLRLMRILLDESLPRKLALELPGHHAQTVQKRGWSGLNNGALLREASQEFQVLSLAIGTWSFNRTSGRCPSRPS